MLLLERLYNVEHKLLPDLCNSFDDETLIVEGSLKIVGHCNQFLLFSVDTFSKSDAGQNKTHIGKSTAEDLDDAEIVYSHSISIDVLVAAINNDLNLLAISYKLDNVEKDVYTSILVELNNTKLFSLAIDTSHTQYLMFLPWTNAKERGKRKEHLLFFMEKRTLGQLHIITTENDKNMIEVQNIQKEVLVQVFVWFQLDIERHRLYYIFLQRPKDKTSDRDTVSKFNTIAFSSRHAPELILSVELPLPLNPTLYHRTGARYVRSGTLNAIPDYRVTIRVVNTDINSLAVCTAVGDTYQINIIHSGVLVECKTGITADNTPILFLNLRSYIIVYTPLHLLHFIDASSYHDNKFHLASSEIPKMLDVQTVDDMCQTKSKYLVLAPLCYTTDKEITILYKMKVVYKVKIDPTVLLDQYCNINCYATWSFLLHLTVCHLNNPQLAHKMILHSLKSDGTMNIVPLLKEYLISTTYMKLQSSRVDRSILSALPLMDANKNLAVLPQNRIFKTETQLLETTKPFITAQKKHLITEAGPYKRFDLEGFVDKFVNSSARLVDQPQGSLTGDSSSHSSERKTGSSGSYASGESNTAKPLVELDREDESMLETLTSALAYHLRRRFHDIIPFDECRTTAKAFFTKLIHSARSLTSLVLIACNKRSDWLPDNLEEVIPYGDTEKLYKLTSLLKFVFLQIGCPRPPHFDWIHFAAAYKSLQFEVFLRHLKMKLIRVSPTITKKVLTEFSSCEDKQARILCSALISALPYKEGQSALPSWQCITRRQFYCQYQLGEILKTASKTDDNTDFTTSQLKLHPFPPVSSFFSSLNNTMDADDRILQYLCENIMEFTLNEEGSETLSSVLF